MQKVSGIIIHQITTRRGTWFQLKSRTWVYVPEVISSLLIGSKGEFEGEIKRQKGCKPFIYVRNYSIPEPFNIEEVINKVMRLLEKINFKAMNLLKIQAVLNLLVYLFVIGKIALIKKLAKWKAKKIIEYCHSPYSFYFNKHLDFQSTNLIANVLMVEDGYKIYPYAHFILVEAYKSGKEFLTIEELHRKILKGLRNEITLEELKQEIENNSRKMIVFSGDKAYLSSVYYMRQKCLNILANKNIPSLNVFDGLPQQLRAILQWKYSILTGQAGTGKTTLIKQLKNSSLNIKFTATIGKTAKNLDESATTIHDLLGYPKFQIKEIEADIVVIDESSMLTWQLLYHALTKIKGHIIFVGDPEQTSPVHGAGIFKEMIEVMPEGSVKKLETVYRTVNTKREIIKAVDRKTAILKVINLASYFEKKSYDWQILTPLKRVAYDLNNRIQYCFRGNGSSEPFRVGDRVMFLKNLRIDGILVASNGQTGTVVGRDGQYYVVRFGDRLINCLEEEITLAYAMTIHKGTGSEHDYVICYIPYGMGKNEEFFSDDLIEVADTRAKVKTIFICEDTQTVLRIKNYVMT
ncbi:MAG: ATP-dependent RecD-like DNA helicase [Thermoplasmata archaeon]